MSLSQDLVERFHFGVLTPESNSRVQLSGTSDTPAKTYIEFDKKGGNISFDLDIQEIDPITNVVLHLHHRQISKGKRKMKILVNDESASEDTTPPQDETFKKEVFTLEKSKFRQGQNLLEISLSDNCSDAYRLSFADIYIERLEKPEETASLKLRHLLLMKTQRLISMAPQVIKELRQRKDKLDTLFKTSSEGSSAEKKGQADNGNGSTFAKMVHAQRGETKPHRSSLFGNGDESMTETQEPVVGAAESDQYVNTIIDISELTSHEDASAALSSGERDVPAEVKQWIEKFDARFYKPSLGRALLGDVSRLLELGESLSDNEEDYRRVRTELETAVNEIRIDTDLNAEFINWLHNGYLRLLETDMVGGQIRDLALVLKAVAITFPGENTKYAENWLRFTSSLTKEGWESFGTLCREFALTLRNKIGREFEEHGHANIDLVLIAHGQVCGPAFGLDSVENTAVIPATIHAWSLFPNKHLSSITFYQPWGVDIDARAVAAIITKAIRPSNVVFKPRIAKPPEHFNTIRHDSDFHIPVVWYLPMKEDYPITTLNDLLNNSPLPKHLFHVLRCEKPVPQFVVTRLIALVTAALSLVHKPCDVRVNLHNASCLSWEKPPQDAMNVDQYCNLLEPEPPEMTSTANLLSATAD